MTDQRKTAKRSTDAAMALANAATATHTMAVIQEAEAILKDDLAGLDRSYEDNMRRALERYRHSVRAALERYNATMATIEGADDDDEDD